MKMQESEVDYDMNSTGLLVAIVCVVALIAMACLTIPPEDIDKVTHRQEIIEGPGLGHHGDYAVFDEEGKFIGLEIEE